MAEPTPSASSWDQPLALRIIAEQSHLDGALLPILHALQDRFGYVDDEVVPAIADSLNLSRAEVHGVITFYHHFRWHAPKRHIVQVCRAEACQAMGAVALERHVKARLGTDYHAGSDQPGAYTLEPIYCFGNCACGPTVSIDGELHGRVTPERFDELLREAEAGS